MASAVWCFVASVAAITAGIGLRDLTVELHRSMAGRDAKVARIFLFSAVMLAVALFALHKAWS